MNTVIIYHVINNNTTIIKTKSLDIDVIYWVYFPNIGLTFSLTDKWDVIFIESSKIDIDWMIKNAYPKHKLDDEFINLIKARYKLLNKEIRSYIDKQINRYNNIKVFKNV